MSTTAQANAASSVRSWLDEWAEAIRANDIARGEALFSPEASGFGTVTLMTDGLADLVARQWCEVWPRTSGFRFGHDAMRIRVSPDAMQACVQTLWHSFSKDGADVGRRRTGRATIVLTRPAPDAAWRGAHTHFSMWPDMADKAIREKTGR